MHKLTHTISFRYRGKKRPDAILGWWSKCLFDNHDEENDDEEEEDESAEEPLGTAYEYDSDDSDFSSDVSDEIDDQCNEPSSKRPRKA